ncbi:MAG: hypothetical protein ACR2LK_04260, partial [Solirubrobacteraceae bacterium]
MSDRIPGELVALVTTPDHAGDWRLAAIIATPGGAQVGVLVAPRNGDAGVLGFEPIPRLMEGLRGNEHVAALLDAPVDVQAAGVDPND